jgi:hypothetical protein
MENFIPFSKTDVLLEEQSKEHYKKIEYFTPFPFSDSDSDSDSETSEPKVPEDIDIMIKMVYHLEKIPKEFRNADYATIFKCSKDYLIKHCKHDYIKDYIDIDPDYGAYITYCKICETTIPP